MKLTTFFLFLVLAVTTQADEFTTLVERVQKNPGSVTADDVTKLLQLGKQLNRPYTASMAVKAFLSQNLNAPAPLLRAAAESAALAGDFRTAASRYKQYLRAAPAGAEASDAAAQLYRIQLDFLNAGDDAYRFMDEFGDNLRQSVAARKYDQWFLNAARERKQHDVVARRLAVIFADQLPLEQERLWYWDTLEWLMTEISAAQPAHFPALPHCRRILPLLRESPALSAKYNFYVANLAFRANAPGKEAAALDKEFDTVTAAARAYIDAVPTAAAMREILTIFTTGDLNRQLAQKREFYVYAFGKLTDADRETMLNVPLPTTAQLIDLGTRYPEVFRRASATANLVLISQTNDLALLQKEAAFLQGVPALNAALINSMATSTDSLARAQSLIQKESWYLSFTDLANLLSQLLPAGDPALLKFSADSVAKSPLALLQPGLARDYILAAYRRDRDNLAAHIHALDWVPYTEDQRKLVFGAAYAEFKQLPAAQAPAGMSALFVDALAGKVAPNVTAPTPLCEQLAKAVLAIRAKDLTAYTAAARAILPIVRDYETKKTPFGAAVMDFLMTYRTEVGDTLDLQCEILADQFTLYKAGTANRGTREALNTLMRTRPGWGWGVVPPREKPALAKVNAVIGKAMLDQLARNEFNTEVFNWLRNSRGGSGWNDQTWNTNVLAQMIDRKILLKSTYRLQHPSATCTYLWLLRSEFAPLSNQYPAERYFDDMFAEETRATRYVDVGFWGYTRDEQHKAANAAAEVLQSFDKCPFGYDATQPVYSRAAFWEAHARAMGADDAPRNALLTKLETLAGKTRFDNYANGHMSITYRTNVTTPEGRKQFFDRLTAYLTAVENLPVRPPTPSLSAVPRLSPPSLTDAELNTFLQLFRVAPAAQWVPGTSVESVAQLVYDELRGKKRDAELFALLSHFWKIARETGNPPFQRAIAQWGNGMTDAGLADLAAAHSGLGLDMVGSSLPEDARNTLLAIRSKSLASVGSIIPVERGDRRYPIFAAQASFLGGKLENAWEQYLGSRDLVNTAFRELDPTFTIWLIERHTDLGNYDDAEALARTLIQWMDSAPQSFDPEIRARLLVSFASISFARQEYPRARAQFEQIATAQEFAGTLAKREADLKVAEVDRLTKHYDQAVERLEKIVRRKDAYLQAQGNYQLALVKFDQEQYPEARQFLDQVFAVEPTHASARILEGKLYLKLKKLVEATEVRVGLAANQRTIVPGKVLKVQLEDRNLAIAGKSANIEIRVWADSGDEEIFNLLPFGDSKTKFEGTLPTTLGAPKKGDRTLQLLGADTVHYDYSDRFKQQHKITAGEPVSIAVVSDGELYISSGKILSKEELEQRALESMIRSRLREEELPANTVALSTVRSEKEIKPGSPINIRVIDLDESKTAGKNTITVRAATSSGDRVNAFTLEETKPYSGVFEGRLPTASAPATAFASDSEEGREPNFVISGGDFPAWVALADSKRPKIFTVDLNNNVALGKLSILADVPGRRLKSFILQSSLNGREFANVAAWPQSLPVWNGQLQWEIARYAGQLPVTLDQFRDYLDVGCSAAGIAKTILTPAPLAGNATKLGLAPDSAYICRLAGAFQVTARQVRTFRLDHKNQLRDVRYFLTVDGQMGNTPYEVTRSLSKGLHRLELYVFVQRRPQFEFELLADIPQPPYIASCPASLFDGKLPDTAPATIASTNAGVQFDVTFAAESRARVLRLWLMDFETDAPAIKKLTLTSADGQPVLPTAQDVVNTRNNQVLEIVPGDRITVTYDDGRVIAKEKQVLEDFLTATFHNATLSACFIESTVDASGNRTPQYIPMRRFKPGDTINVFINDADGDVSDSQDRLKFTAQAGDGKRVELEALETEPHSGIFLGKVFPVTGAPQRPAEITVKPNDDVVIGYFDRENTDPGIAWERTFAVEQTSDAVPQLRAFDITSRPLTEAELKAAARADTKHIEESFPVTRSIMAAWPAVPATNKPAAGLLGCPLLVELAYPTIAQSFQSTAAIYVQTGAARRQAGVAADAPFNKNLPGTLKYERPVGDIANLTAPLGYRDVLIRGNPKAGDPLEDGRFTFVIPTRLGTSGTSEDDQVDVSITVPTIDRRGEARWAGRPWKFPVLGVRGDDEVFIGFQYVMAGATNWVTQRVSLSADAFFDVMERRYQEPLSTLHVGETMYLRIVDPSRDLSDQRDEAPVTLTSSSGTSNTVNLSETFAHSGIFKGKVDLFFAGDLSKSNAPSSLLVKYGDTVQAVYNGGKVARSVRVYQGSNGEVLPFSKRFKDPEIAVQTQFTVAEAYFEMAKKHRELQQEELARREIAQGKKLLEEAIRDYPNTEARAQADYLLADLALEGAADTTDPEAKKKQYMEAVVRFSDIVATYPDSTYAPKAQFKKALIFEKSGQMDQACEEYVKLSYRYPDNELVAETIARLGQYFLTKGKEIQDKSKAETNTLEREKLNLQCHDMYKTAAQVFGRLAERFPEHRLAGKTQVLSGQCWMRAEDYPRAIEVFVRVATEKKAEPDLIAQAMYWCGDSYMKLSPPDFVNAYRQFKRLTWDYPDGQWAKFARGRLTEDALAKVEQSDSAAAEK